MPRFVKRRLDTSKPVAFGVFEGKFDYMGKLLYAMTKSPTGEYKFHKTIQSLTTELTSIPAINWFCYKDSEADFDFAHTGYQMVEWAKKHGHTVKPRQSGRTILGLVLRKPIIIYKPGKRKPTAKNYKALVIDKHRIQKITIRNAKPMITLTLNEAIRLFAPHMTLPGELDVKPNPKNKNHMHHLQKRLDCMEAAIKGHEHLTHQTWGVYPGWTTSGTARKAWRAGIPEGVWYWRLHKLKEDFIEKAYYAAFLYPGTTTDTHHNSMDIDESGAYAERMREGVPYGHPTWTREFKENHPGFYEVYAEAPSTNWPLVPYKDNNSQLHWTNDSCTTYLSDIEIKWYSNKGWHFYINEGVFFDRIIYPFNGFIDKCESLEYPDGKPANPAIKAIVKQMRNRLYGSFALKKEQETIIFKKPTMAELREWAAANTHTPLRNEVTGEQLPAWIVLEKADADYINNYWAAYITARQRLHIFDVMELIGLEHNHYVDTDGIKSDRDAIMKVLPTLNQKVGYGSWVTKAKYDWFKMDAPKAIHGKYTDEWADSQGMETPYFGMEAGVPKNMLVLHPEYYTDNAPLNFNTVASLKHALQYPNEPFLVEKQRTLHQPWEGNSAWKVLPNHTIVPRPIVSMPYFDGKPAVISAKHAIKWLRKLGVGKIDILIELSITKDVYESILKGHSTGNKYLEQLCSMVETKAHRVMAAEYQQPIAQ
jgi:hypothetical protein